LVALFADDSEETGKLEDLPDWHSEIDHARLHRTVVQPRQASDYFDGPGGFGVFVYVDISALKQKRENADECAAGVVGHTRIDFIDENALVGFSPETAFI
jgi:hypothetical protein